MAFDFDLLTISRFVVHQIFERTDDAVPEPNLSEHCTALDQRGLVTLQNRIVKALGSGNHGIEMNVRRTGDGTFFQHATKAIHSTETFVDETARIAELLNEAQSSRRLPGGIVVVLKGKVGTARNLFLAVIKAEIHEGFATQRTDTEVLMSYLDSLALTPNQKLYKIGFLAYNGMTENAIEAVTPNVANYRAFLYDHYMSAKETRTAALYFYSQFLGFEVRESDKKLTRDFFELTRKFISEVHLDDEVKMNLQQCLYVELKSNNCATIQIHAFAESYLPQDTRDDYVNHMTNNGFPEIAVCKDTEYISRNLRRRKLHYSSDVEITAPSEQFDELITVVSEDELTTTLRIRGKLRVLE